MVHDYGDHSSWFLRDLAVVLCQQVGERERGGGEGMGGGYFEILLLDPFFASSHFLTLSPSLPSSLPPFPLLL